MAASGWLRAPDPIRVTSCGMLETLFEIDRLAVRDPPAIGANCKFTWQVSPAATVPHMLATMMKSPVFAPVMLRLLITNAAVPQFVMVRLCTLPVAPTPTVPKLIGLLPTHIAGANAVPTPLRLKIVGLPVALCAIATVARRVPAAVGVNVALIVHVPPAEIGLPLVQSLETEKSFDPVPEIVTLEMIRSVEPQFVIVTLCTALVVPINWLEKVSVLLELKQRSGTAGVAVPVSGMLRGLQIPSSVNTRVACRSPFVVGANATTVAQLPRGAPELPLQPCDKITKSAALDPPIDTFEIPTGTVVPFWYVTACPALVFPTI